MKLIVQIPCYNEAETLANVINEIPRDICDIDQVEVLVIDDGSTDDTVQIAKESGADHVIQHRKNYGLAASFRSGFDFCRKHGADIVVNTDGDQQYDGREIPALIKPIIEGRADLIVGDRAPSTLKHFSYLKRGLQKLGSRVVSLIANTWVPDATSGFRAYSSEALYRLTIETSFSHSIETLVQAVGKGLIVESVPIKARATERQSRLAHSKRHFILRSIATIVRAITYYRPLTFYWTLGGLLSLIGTAPILRFLWFFLNDDGRGHIQSLVIGGTLLVMGFTCMLFGVMAAQINSNRRLLEEMNERMRRMETGSDQQKKRHLKKMPPLL